LITRPNQCRDRVTNHRGDGPEPHRHGARGRGLPGRVGRSDGADLRQFGDRINPTGEVQLRRRPDDRFDLVGDGADLDHQRRRQHHDADGFVGVLIGDREQTRRDQVRRLLALDQRDPQLAQHRGDLRVVMVLPLGKRLRYLLADRLQEPSRPAGLVVAHTGDCGAFV
jgi:hypothetical protein